MVGPKNIRRRRQSDDDRIMPLINVVFLLLIFFMIAGQLTTTDPFSISPPSTTRGSDPNLEPLLVLIGRDGQLAMDGRLMQEDTLVAHFAETAMTAVRLKADGAVPATRVIALMERLRDAGLEDLQLLTVPVAE